MSIKPVLPSSLLKFAEKEYYDSFANVYSNTSLRIGVVKAIYDIEDENNASKSNTEYDVLVFQQDSNKGVIPIVYRGCVTLDSFGGIGDFMEFAKSAPTDTKTKSLKADDGSYVLLLCIDGTSSRGVIIGALPHHDRKSTLQNLKGSKHMEGEYNGIRVKVNKDGELTITFKGATDKKGKPKDPSKGGSQIRMEKDGSVEINDRDLDGELKAGNNKEAKDDSKAGDEYEKLRINKPKKSIELNTRGDFTETIGANSNSTVKGTTTHKTAKLIMEASGSASLTSGGTFDIKSGGALGIKSPSGKMDFDDSLTVNASAVNILAQSINLGQGGTPAVILNTQTIGIGNLGGPVVSTMIGPFSSTVFIAP